MSHSQTPQPLYGPANSGLSTDLFITFFIERDPTPQDTNYPVGKRWFNTLSNDEFMLKEFNSSSGFVLAVWVLLTATVPGGLVVSLTGNDLVPVGPDLSGDINVVGTAPLSTSGNPGTNTLTIVADGTVPTTFNASTGSANPAGHILNVLGTTGITTTGAGNTITIASDGTLASSFHGNTGTATPLLGVLNIVGSPGTTTTGASNTITITNVSMRPYIVGATNSDFTTIQPAINQAVADGASLSNRKNVFIKAGTYVGNITLASGVNLVGGSESNLYSGGPSLPGSDCATIITGTVILTAGECNISNISVNSIAGNSPILVTGNNSFLTADNCSFIANNTNIIGFTTVGTKTIVCKNCILSTPAGGLVAFDGSAMTEATLIFNTCNVLTTTTTVFPLNVGTTTLIFDYGLLAGNFSFLGNSVGMSFSWLHAETGGINTPLWTTAVNTTTGGSGMQWSVVGPPGLTTHWVRGNAAYFVRELFMQWG